MTYQPVHVSGNSVGLVQSREEFLLPNDAYPTLENAFIWRERIKRKQGCQTLGRLSRAYTNFATPATITLIAGSNNYDLKSALQINTGTSEVNAEIEPGNITPIVITISNGQTLTDASGTGTFVVTGAGIITAATVNYQTFLVVITASAPGGPFNATISLVYFPGLPVMGLRTEELNATNNERTVAFDQKYAYRFNNGWQDFLTSTPTETWTGSDSDFFWSTNYWVGIGNLKIFWVTNDVDPIRYTNGDPASLWVDFTPGISNGDASQLLLNALMILPFRSRLLVLNTIEGHSGAGVNYPQRIRWAEIGNPFSLASPIVSDVVPEAWYDDIRGKGGFLDIPTSESIISCGYVRDNLVIFCERSTWQLRYTGRSIAPFQIERVNSELGTESTFSAIQFDTSLVGVGDKGIVECDSYKSNRIDIKIPDLVFEITNNANAPQRVHGIRDFQQKLAYWTYPYSPSEDANDPTYPNRRLVYNYENDSWAIFIDSFTCFGTFQNQSGRRWQDFTDQNDDIWEALNSPWVSDPSLFPSLIAGNQQGFVVYLGNNLTGSAINSVTLSIQNIVGNTTTATTITSPNHNLEDNAIIQIFDILAGSSFDLSLNSKIFRVAIIDANTFDLYKYNSTLKLFEDPQLDPPGTYSGGGKIAVKDNFSIFSKKFNFLDEGQNIQIGFIDLLMNNTSLGAITLNVYLDYNDDDAINQYPFKGNSDDFFNITIPTTCVRPVGSSKNWQRVYCAVRGAFLTLEYTLSNAQMNGAEQQSDVQIDSQILWMRRAGRQLIPGL